MDSREKTNKKQKRVLFAPSSALSFLTLLSGAVIFLWQSLASAAPGSVLPSFGTNGTYVLPAIGTNDDDLLMTHVVVQPDGSILLAGHNFSEAVIVKLTSAGALDTTYGVNGVVRIAPAIELSGAMLQPDGKLLIGLRLASGGRVVRLSALGAIDTAFGTAGSVTTIFSVEAMAIAGDNKIVIGGQTVLSRLQANGAIDNTFGVNGLIQLPSNVWPRSIAVDADLSIIAAGEFVFPGVPRRQRIAKIFSSGALDGLFGTMGVLDVALPTIYGNVSTLKVVFDTSRRILVAGESEVDCGGRTCQTVIVHRLLSQGTLDSTFGNAGLASLGTNNRLYGNDIAVQPDGAMLVAANGIVGANFNTTAHTEIVMARLLSTGALDSNFGVGGISQRDLTAVQQCSFGGTRTAVGIRPDGVAFAVGFWQPDRPGCFFGNAGVSSFLLRDANDDAQPEAWDLTPDPLVFANVVNAPPNTPTASGLATVQGVDAGVAVPMSVSGGELSLNGSTTYRSTAWVANGDQVNVRQQSSATPGASVTMQIAAGGMQPANNIPLVLGSQTASTFTTVTRTGSPGTLSFAVTTASVAENADSISLSVTRSGGSAGVIVVGYATAAGTALSPSDFTATTGNLIWANGETASKTIIIPIVNDGGVEPSESFTISLLTPSSGALLGNATTTVTINDDDTPVMPGQFAFAATTLSVGESAGSVTLAVARFGGTSGAVSVSYTTANGSASAGTDYTTTSGTLSWADGDMSARTVTIPILNDTVSEPTKSFTVSLSTTTGGATIATANATVSIVDDDAVTPPPSPPASSDDGGGGGALSIELLLALLLTLARVFRHRVAASNGAKSALRGTR